MEITTKPYRNLGAKPLGNVQLVDREENGRITAQ